MRALPAWAALLTPVADQYRELTAFTVIMAIPLIALLFHVKHREGPS